MTSALIAVAALLAVAWQPPAEETCYADCADGLTPVRDLGPAAGEVAPGFRAILLEPDTGVAAARTLEELLDEQPVILAFGSYT